MTERTRLKNRRASETYSLECAGLRYTATISRFDDGRVGEVFLSSYKSGSAADAASRDSAIVCSIALQFGADLDVVRAARRRARHHRQRRECTMSTASIHARVCKPNELRRHGGKGARRASPHNVTATETETEIQHVRL